MSAPCGLCGGSGEVEGRVPESDASYGGMHFVAFCPLCRHADRYHPDHYMHYLDYVPWVGRVPRLGNHPVVVIDDEDPRDYWVDEVWSDGAKSWFEPKENVVPWEAGP